MELKLQQAIVATRAGRTDIAQQLLTHLLQDNPDDANAWFLLGNIVDTPERQSLYLQHCIKLDPDHAVAEQRLNQLENPLVSAPVISQQKSQDDAAEAESDEAVLLPQAEGVVPTDELSEMPQVINNNQLESESSQEEMWHDSAGPPIRETSTAPTETAAPAIPQSPSDPEAVRSSSHGEESLARIIVVMFLLAAIVLAVLVVLIFV